MNKSKTKKLALLTTVILVISVFSFIPMVQAKQPSTSIRPIEDWLDAGFSGNPFGAGPGYLDPDSGLAQRCLKTVDDIDAGVTYDGYIVETFRKDKSLQYTIYIDVWDMPMAIRDFTAIGTVDEWIFVGVMNFTYTTTFILEKHVRGGLLLDFMGEFVLDNKGEFRPLIEPFWRVPAGPRGPGADLPEWWILYWYQHVISGHFVMLDFQSVGSGNYIAPGWNPPFQDPEAGEPDLLLEEGTVEVWQQAFYSYDLDLNDPEVYQGTEWLTPDGVFKEGGKLRQSPLLMPETWPLEYVTLTPTI